MLKVSNIYTSNELGDILFIVLSQLIQNNDTIRTCQNCGRYFIPNKLNEIYCDFLNKDGTTCRDKGAGQTYKKNLQNIPGLLEYRRTYNKKFNAISRNKEDTKLKENFDERKKSAQAEIKKFKQNIITDEELYNKLLEEKGFTYAITRIASPGKSEHQTGLALDFCIYKDGKCYIEHDVEDKIETKWIHQNSHRYGFIIRYPEGKEDITKYSYEPWHLRYVGNIASSIYNNNLTLEEYKDKESIK